MDLFLQILFLPLSNDCEGSGEGLRKISKIRFSDIFTTPSSPATLAWFVKILPGIYLNC